MVKDYSDLADRWKKMQQEEEKEEKEPYEFTYHHDGNGSGSHMTHYIIITPVILYELFFDVGSSYFFFVPFLLRFFHLPV